MKTVPVTQYLNADHYSEYAYPRPFHKKQVSRPAHVDLKIPSVRCLIRQLERFH